MNIQEKFYRDFMTMLNKHDVQFIMVGGYAVAFHGYTRYSRNLDLWVNPSKQNMKKVISAIAEFGYETDSLNNHIFSPKDSPIKLQDGLLKVGVIQHLTNMVNFDEAYNKSRKIGCEEFWFHLLDYYHLEKNKHASGLDQDLIDVSKLRETRELSTGEKAQTLF